MSLYGKTDQLVTNLRTKNVVVTSSSRVLGRSNRASI